MFRLVAIFATSAAAQPGVTPFHSRSSRRTVGRELSKRFGGAIGAELLSNYVAGKFIPMFAEDEKIDDQYVVSWNKDCVLPQWTEQEGMKHLDRVRLTLIKKEAGTDALLMALRDTGGCVSSVTQDFMFRLPESERVTTASWTSSKVLEGRRLRNDPGLPWGIDFLDADFSETYTPAFDGSGVRAYIVDTGIDDTHPWLPNVLSGYDALGENITQDPNGHGTHCAGTVGGTYVGVAPGVDLVPVRVLGAEGAGSLLGIVDGLDWVAQQKDANPSIPMVASMSLGGVANAPTNEAADTLFEAGVTVIVAAGNSFVPGEFFSPCSATYALCVGALEVADPWAPGDVFAPASYSNWGDKVEIWAPGSAVNSARSGQMIKPPAEPGINWTISGTSMACPHVAGIAAQILQWNTASTPTQVVSMLKGDCSVNFGAGTIKRSPSLVARTTNSATATTPCAGGFAADIGASAIIPWNQNPTILLGGSCAMLLLTLVACVSAFFIPKRKTPSLVEQQKQASGTPNFVLGHNLSEYFIPEGYPLPNQQAAMGMPQNGLALAPAP